MPDEVVIFVRMLDLFAPLSFPQSGDHRATRRNFRKMGSRFRGNDPGVSIDR
jgi:hypothetical protein